MNKSVENKNRPSINKWCSLLFILLATIICRAQDNPLTLDQCMDSLQKNYPAINKVALQQHIDSLQLAVLDADWLPQGIVNAQATYQSDVTALDIAIPGAPPIEPLSKDQYKVYLEVNQKIYDGGITSVRRDLQNLGSLISQTRVQITIDSAKTKLVDYYFNVLLADRNLAILESSKAAVSSNLKQLESRLRNGVAMQSQVDALKVEVLKLDQQVIGLLAGRKLSLRLIALLTNMDITGDTVLTMPSEIQIYDRDYTKRPEWKILDLRGDVLDNQQKLKDKSLIPRLGLFGQAGYGRPALNMLKNEFDTYYLGGVRLSWDLSNIYSLRKEQKITQFNSDLVEVDKQTLTEQLDSRYEQQLSEIEKNEKLIEKDDEIIKLRQGVTKASSSQLANGISTTTDYLTEFQNEIDARQQKALHEIQFETAKYNIKILTGN